MIKDGLTDRQFVSLRVPWLLHAKVQINLCRSACASTGLISTFVICYYSTCYRQYFTISASFCSWASWFKWTLLGRKPRRQVSLTWGPNMTISQLLKPLVGNWLHYSAELDNITFLMKSSPWIMVFKNSVYSSYKEKKEPSTVNGRKFWTLFSFFSQ